MKSIILLIGLPGSGKTHYGNSLISSKNKFIDDIKEFSSISDALKEYDELIVSDPYLCIDYYRECAVKLFKENFPEISLKWIFWENNPEKAYKNVVNRNDGRVISKNFVFDLSKKYNPPNITFNVYENNKTEEENYLTFKK